MPMEPIKFFVPGHARPGGSKKPFLHKGRDGKLHATMADDSGEKGKSWRQDVKYAGMMAYRGPLLDCALEVAFVFFMQRPKAHYTKKGLRPNAPNFHTIKPDALKLARSAEDALTGVIWTDDSRTARLHVSKIYGDKPGVLVEIREAE